MLNSIVEMARSLSIDEKEELVRAVRAMVMEDEAGRDPADACPRCGHRHTVSKGRSASGAPRRLCRGCGRTFSSSTGNVLALSKLGAATWSDYVAGALEGLSLRALAGRCGVSLYTSWYMRVRLCSAMSGALAPFRCSRGTSVQVDEKYPNESLSGNRARARVGMPRAPHATGHDVRERGLSSLKVCVVTGVNDLGDAFAGLAGRGRASADGVRAAISGVALAGADVSTDMLAGYVRPLEEAGVLAHNRYNSAEAGDDELGMVNALHSRLSKFLGRFNGVSTRRLPLYLAWFCWEEQARRSDARRLGMLTALVANGSYSVRRAALHDEPQPFWGYWDGKEWEPAPEEEWPPELLAA